VSTQAIFRDVTEQRRAERELAASRANLAALVENTGDAIWSVDTRQRLVTFNSGFALAVEARSGREPRVGDSPESVFGTGQAYWYRNLYDRVLGGERFSALLEEQLEGQQRVVEIYCNPVLEAAGTTGAVMFGKDVTRRLSAEEALRVAKEEAELANRAKTHFLANMSHELRTPLNSVIGFANILLKNKKGNFAPQDLSFLERILANGRHLLALINEVLDLAKIEAGRMEVELRETDLAELIGETLEQLEGQARERRVTLAADVPAAAAPMYTDPPKLKQVLINLVGNAMKFTEGGQVTVRLEVASDGATPDGVAVEDTGIGIPQERLDAIFEAFQQADAGTSRRYGGTGLGLTISRSICNLLGYELTVTSEVGRGSTFTIHFPSEEVEVVTADGGAMDTGSGEASATGRGRLTAPGEPDLMVARGLGPARPPPFLPLKDMRGDFRVLVVDDEGDARTLMSHYLSDLGCTVLTAASGVEGLALARVHLPDLITLDLMMPGMNGWEVLRALKDDPILRPIPVVVVSVVASERRGRLLGAVDLLTKPVDREDLLRVLWRNLVRHRTGRVLVVEDDPDARVMLSEYLKGTGLEVRAVANGREALRAVEEEAPDAVILDLIMPVMDGVAFLDRLREDPYHTGLPVIVLTGKDLSDEELHYLDEKATTVMAKGEGVHERLREVLSAFLPLGD
jgi:signal transduction histidine kinase/DNA-binding response OmpR family regulator